MVKPDEHERIRDEVNLGVREGKSTISEHLCIKLTIGITFIVQFSYNNIIIVLN